MKNLRSFLRRLESRLCGAAVGLIFLASAGAAAGVTVSGSTGANGSYTTLKGAFDAINANLTQTGNNIFVTIDSDTDEGAASAVLSAGNWATLRVQPTGARTITGATVAGSPLIGLNGADRVTIDGLNAGGNSLTISNTTVSETAGTSTIRLINGAQNNTITNCTILGSSTTAAFGIVTAGGNVLIGTTTSALNSGNTVSNNNLGPAGSNLPSKCVMLSGSSGFSTRNNVIANNNVFDFLGTNSAGIAIYHWTDTTTVSNNRIYQTAPRTTDGRYFGILMSPNLGQAGTATITGNRIGFGAADGTGVTTISGSGNRINAIAVFFSSTLEPTLIQGNTISGFNQTTGANGSNSTTPFVGILAGNGNSSSLFVDIGGTGGNTIGSLDGSSGIVTNRSFNGILLNDFTFGSPLEWVISNNNVGTITIAGDGPSAGFRGIHLAGASGQHVTVKDNTIGGMAAGSITNNLVPSAETHGIFLGGSNVTVTGNLVRNMVGSSNVSLTDYYDAAVAGIFVNYGPTGANTISQNTVHSLSNQSDAAGNKSVYGIACVLGASAANVVERNFVHSLSVTSTDLTARIVGIGAFNGTATYKNNMVRLGLNAAGAHITGGYPVYGIFEQDLSAANGYPPTISKISANTVYVGGANVASSSDTYGLLSTVLSGTREYQDNIFWNARSNASGAATNYAIGLSGTGFTSNFNDLFASGTGGAVGAFDGVAQATLANWQTATGQDGMSISANPLLGNPTGNATTVDLHLGCGSPVIGAGTALAAVTNDFDGDPRPASMPDIGADEVTFVAPANLRIVSISRAENGHVLLQCLGVPNQINNLQTSPDLSPGSFTTIFPPPPPADATGAFSYEDAGAANLTKRFYRLACP
jgi:trimeric autotransporter adhesin